MNSKWYIGTLVVLLSLIGLTFDQTRVVNQKIVLQFSDTNTSSGTVHEDALATITAKLQALGITDIEVLENNDAQLSLRYFSTIGAQDIKQFLSNDEELLLSLEEFDKLPFDFPEDELPEICSLVVLDLHEIEDGLSLNGKFAYELNKDDREFLNAPVASGNIVPVLGNNYPYDLSFKINRTVIISINTGAYIFPEVRAGPILQNHG